MFLPIETTGEGVNDVLVITLNISEITEKYSSPDGGVMNCDFKWPSSHYSTCVKPGPLYTVYSLV